MESTFKISQGDEIITLAKGWFSEDAGHFETEKLEIKISEITKKRLLFAQQECEKHGWWAIEVRLNEGDDVRYLDEEGNEDPDYRADVEYYRVNSDSMIFYSQHKHNSCAQIESEFFNIE